jgi:hypothetical protein
MANWGTGVSSYDVKDISTKEMDEIVALRNKLAKIIRNHHTKCEKKEYLSDDDVLRIWAVLSVIAGNHEARPTSSFEKFLTDNELGLNDRIKEQLS